MTKLPNLTAVRDTQPMSPAQSEMMITLMLGGQDLQAPVPPAELETALLKLFNEKFTQDLAVQVMLQRLKLTDVLYDPRVVAMASFLSDRPGFAVLWAYTLFQRTLELGHPYTFDDLVHDFPMGFPTPEASSKIWDAQKGWAQEPKQQSDNLLDGVEPWKTPEVAGQ